MKMNLGKKLITGALSTIIALTACTGCGSSSSTHTNKLVFVDWGGTNTEARTEANIKPFEDEFDCDVTIVTPSDYSKLIAMVENGTTEWDVMNCDAYWGVYAGNEGYLEPIDYSVVTEQIDPSVQLDYVMGAEVYSSVIAYNTDKYTEETAPQSWADFWDTEKYPGKRAMWQNPVTVLEAALLADGVPMDELYPLDVDRALNKLDEIKDDIIWWSEGAQPSQMLSTGEADLALAWSGRILTAQDEGSPIGLTYNQGLRIAAGWVVPKGAPNKDMAMKFIEYISRAESQAAFSEKIPYGSTNSDATALMSDELKAKIGQTDEQMANEMYIDNTYWAENLASVQEKFNAWVVQ
jgi:putative spermidine/putrescine transport system substrate-binding protein